MKDGDYTMPVDAKSLHLPFRAGYKAAEYANYGEFADDCNLSQSNVSKFLTGALKNPNIFNLAAMARSINGRVGRTLISLDELMGIEHRGGCRCAEHAELESELESLRRACAEKDDEIADLRRAAEVAGEKLSVQRKALYERHPLIGGLLLVIVLLIILLGYVIADASNPMWGFFKG